MFGDKLRQFLHTRRLAFEVQLLSVGMAGKVENRHPPLVRLKKAEQVVYFCAFLPNYFDEAFGVSRKQCLMDRCALPFQVLQKAAFFVGECEK